MKYVTSIMLLVAVACGGNGKREQGEGGGSHAPSHTMEGMEGMAMADAPIRVTAAQAALAGVTFAVAREEPPIRTVRAVAIATPDERALGIVNARVTGWIEKLHVEETGSFVREGQPLFEIYAPELVTAQEELLLARHLAGIGGGDTLRAAARRRLMLWGISEEEISAIEQSGEPRRRLTIRSPYRGHILEKHVLEGQMIKAGDPLFKIADLSTIWIEPAIFEADISSVQLGQRAEVVFDALPGHLLVGRVTFIYPELDMKTRTLKVRIEVPNRELLIKPGMYGTVRIVTHGPRGVVVPLTAVLPTGARDLAFVVRRGEVFPTEVVVGWRGDSTILVADGLAAGDTVVASATFLFDSESQLAAAMAGIMLNMGMGLDMGGMPMPEMSPGQTEMQGSPMQMKDMPKDRGKGRRP